MPHRTKSKHGKGAFRIPQPAGTIRKHGHKRGTMRGPRQAVPFLPNVKGTRFVRDASKPGIASKRVSKQAAL